MPDYRELYLTLMREVEKSVELLINAEQKCEDMYSNSDGDFTQNSSNENIPNP